MSEESSDAIYGYLVTLYKFYAYIEHLIFDRKVQVRKYEICLFVMREYIKTIPKYTNISAQSVRFSHKINNHEHGLFL